MVEETKTELVDQLISELNDDAKSELPKFEGGKKDDDERKLADVVESIIKKRDAAKKPNPPMPDIPPPPVTPTPPEPPASNSLLLLAKRALVAFVLFFVFLTLVRKFTKCIERVPKYCLNFDDECVDLNHVGRVVFAFVFSIAFFIVDFQLK